MHRSDRHREHSVRRMRPLGVEALEDRSLLAVAAFTVELFEDVNGLPGDTISAGTVEVGESFFVEIRAQEFHPLLSGLHGVALNLAWDPDVLAIEGDFDPNSAITGHLPLFRRGALNEAAGTIDDLSGSAFHATGVGRSIGDGVAERFALLHFRAIGESSAALIRMSEGASSIVAQPTATFTSGQLSFEQQTLMVLPAHTPASSDALAAVSVELFPELEIAVPPPGPIPSTPAETLPPEIEAPETAAIEMPASEVAAPVIAASAPSPSGGCAPHVFVPPPPAFWPSDAAAVASPPPAAASPSITADTETISEFAEVTALQPANDLAFIGPRVMQHSLPAYYRLEEAIAAIAADVAAIHRRRSASA